MNEHLWPKHRVKRRKKPNEPRARKDSERVLTALDALYAANYGNKAWRDDLVDLLTDLRYFAARHGCDFEEACAIAKYRWLGGWEESPTVTKVKLPK